VAQAQATRTWVSGVGDDVNPCSRTAPCKTFAGAISKTADKGEIDCLDPGGFGTITITKSLTIDGQGTMGSILAAGTNGVTVNDSLTATPNSINVSLRNLSINGAGTGFDGIRFLSGKALMVENCIISGFRGNGLNSDGIDIAPSAAASYSVTVKDTIIEDTTGDGIRQNSIVGGNLKVVVDNCTLRGSVNGYEVLGGVGNISRSVVVNHSSSGIVGGGSIGCVVNANDNEVSGNGTGINSAVAGVSTVRISNNNVFNNTTGLNVTGAMESYRNNKVRGNTTEQGGAGAITDISPVNTGIR
jgi:hypothetical protein